jgi:hypothetical protein
LAEIVHQTVNFTTASTVTNQTYTNTTLVFKKGSSISVSGELILNNCKIISDGGINFIGTGIVRGTIDGERIPFEVFNCKHNLQLSSHESFIN